MTKETKVTIETFILGLALGIFMFIPCWVHGSVWAGVALALLEIVSAMFLGRFMLRDN